MSSLDNVFDILSWLPGKAICRFKTTCKSISQFSEETLFKTKQAENSLSKEDTCFIIQPDPYQGHNKRVELHPLPKNQQFSGVSNNFMRFLSKSARVLASSNGLILCCTTNKDPVELFLCNPVTQTWSPIPDPKLLRGRPEVDANVVLQCYHDNDYLIVLCEIRPMELDWHWPSSYVCKVYHAKEGAWKTMKRDVFAGNRNIKFDQHVLHDGELYFISDSFPYLARSSVYFKPYIMCYNLENGISTMVKLPEAATRGSHDVTCNMGIFKWEKVSICLVRLMRKSVFTVWFLKNNYDHGKGINWQMVMKVKVKAMGLKEKDPKVTGFMVMNGDLLVFATEKKVYSYGLSGERYMMVEEICENRCGSKACFISYSDTLRATGAAAATTLPCYNTCRRPGQDNIRDLWPLQKDRDRLLFTRNRKRSYCRSRR